MTCCACKTQGIIRSRLKRWTSSGKTSPLIAATDEAETLEEIRRCFSGTGYLPDTHTAVALHAAQLYKKEESSGAPVVVLSTASPFKFPAAVLTALGETPEGDAFAQMAQLARVSGLEPPISLSGLQGKAYLHNDVIEKTDIADYVLKTLPRL